MHQKKFIFIIIKSKLILNNKFLVFRVFLLNKQRENNDKGQPEMISRIKL
jgi:hypothetical protein